MAKTMNHSEAKIQAEIVKTLRSSGYWCHSVPNDAAGSNAVRQGQQITMGLFPGVADLVVWLPGGRVMYLEVKTPTGKQSPAQVKFQARCDAAGIPYAVARSVESAVEEIAKIIKKSIDKDF
jgi:hypothetical protein